MKKAFFIIIFALSFTPSMPLWAECDAALVKNLSYNLSNESVNVMLMASWLAAASHSQIEPVSLAAKPEVNLYHLFLATMTEIKTSHHNINLSLIGSTVHLVLSDFGVLEDFQAFLLSSLGFNGHSTGPFEVRPKKEEGGITLYVNDLSTLSVDDHFATIDRLLNEAHNQRNADVNYRPGQGQESTLNPPISPEHFLLAILQFDNPIREFLFGLLNERDVAQVRTAFYSAIDELRGLARSADGGLQNMEYPFTSNHFDLSSLLRINFISNHRRQSSSNRRRTNRFYTDEDRANAIALARQLGNASMAARQLDIPGPTVQNWIRRNNVHIEVRTPHREQYSNGFKAVAIVLVKKLGAVETARQLRMPYNTLMHWIHEHEEKTGERLPRELTDYTDEFKEYAIALVKELGSMIEASIQLRMPYGTLLAWGEEHEARTEEHLPKRRNSSHYTDEDKDNAIVLIKETGNKAKASRQSEASYTTLLYWGREYEAETGESLPRQQRSFYTDEDRANGVALVRELGNITRAANQLGVLPRTLGNWVQAHEARTGERLPRGNRER